MTSGARGTLVAMLMFTVATVAHAQGAATPGIELEARIDAILSHRGALQAALGADVPISSAMHLELAAGIGPSFAGNADLSARTDAVVHFLIDPRHATRWSPYAGAGIGARYDGRPGWRALAIIVVGVNAPRWKHAIPFIEAGFSGGIRIGAGLRRAR
ncbi:MAG: hypothetical protein H0U66_09960 [Gemmatimonadaceae bacterium]|nr:hypothetical protein [Gemmatimonadaceae bacterium]